MRLKKVPQVNPVAVRQLECSPAAVRIRAALCCASVTLLPLMSCTLQRKLSLMFRDLGTVRFSLWVVLRYDTSYIAKLRYSIFIFFIGHNNRQPKGALNL